MLGPFRRDRYGLNIIMSVLTRCENKKIKSNQTIYVGNRMCYTKNPEKKDLLCEEKVSKKENLLDNEINEKCCCVKMVWIEECELLPE